MSADKIGAQHRARKAVLYVRQSSAHQVQHNRESGALQYAMRERLMQLGWSEIEVIDDDPRRSKHRRGFILSSRGSRFRIPTICGLTTPTSPSPILNTGPNACVVGTRSLRRTGIAKLPRSLWVNDSNPQWPFFRLSHFGRSTLANGRASGRARSDSRTGIRGVDWCRRRDWKGTAQGLDCYDDLRSSAKGTDIRPAPKGSAISFEIRLAKRAASHGARTPPCSPTATTPAVRSI